MPPASRDAVNPLPCRCVCLHPGRAQPSHWGPEPARRHWRGRPGFQQLAACSLSASPDKDRKQTKENAALSFLAVRLPGRGLLAPREEVWLKRPSLEQLIPRLTKQKKNLRTKPGAANRIKSDGVLPLTLVSQEDTGGARRGVSWASSLSPPGDHRDPPQRGSGRSPLGVRQPLTHQPYSLLYALSIQHWYLLI